MPGRTIGGLAREAGVGVETIRFYERRGLLAQPDKPPQGHRRYGPEALRDLRFIRKAKDLGFTLAEIRDLLDLFQGEGATCGEAARRARAKQAEVRERIAELQEMEAALVRAAEACEACDPACPCPVLERFPFDETQDGCAAPDCAAKDDGPSGR
jgi:MerR family mercuric resistance operon transcriptional regulator